jgi:hypothetical protein
MARARTVVVVALVLVGAAGGRAQLLYAGGEFDRAGDALVSDVAQYDGAAWSPLAARPLLGDSVSSLAVFQGRLIAGGRYDAVGGVATNNIAQYDGNIWRPMGLGAENRDSDFAVDVWAMTVAPSGVLVAAGYFNTAGGLASNNVAQWDGAAWAPMGDGLPNECRALAVFKDKVVAGGDFTLRDPASGALSNDVAQWDGAVWAPLGPGVTSNRSRVWALAEYNGELVVAGEFLEVAGVPVNNTAVWDGATWRALGLGVTTVVGPFDPIVKALVVFRGALILGGRFQLAGDTPMPYIAAWTGTAFAPLGSGLNEQVYSMTVYQDALLVGGNFYVAGGIDAVQIARWDGTSWSSVGFSDVWDIAVYVRALAVGPLPSNAPAPQRCSPLPPHTYPHTPAPPLRPPQRTQTHSCRLVGVGGWVLGVCTLVGTAWEASYVDEGSGVAVTEDLVLRADGVLEQRVAAAAGQPCGPNSVNWTGDYDIIDATTAQLSFIRCTASGPGCLACGPSREQLTRVKYASDCSSVSLVAVSTGTGRVYERAP